MPAVCGAYAAVAAEEGLGDEELEEAAEQELAPFFDAVVKARRAAGGR
jgi:hypothetical protein